ncbi:hypothetical protein DPMN_040912 [Dreissena polymorpha]|uniref:Uncharacterized protein n=1 Tax=Dreissena polymorpha TaxID=45954 RepID=A0A9D4CVY1_DREPO|nr:hypothetical protein DPMN_040912 [Dreissena polymorpha]
MCTTNVNSYMSDSFREPMVKYDVVRPFSRNTADRNLNASDSGLHHTVSLMYVGGRHIGFGTTLENKMEAPS